MITYIITTYNTENTISLCLDQLGNFDLGHEVVVYDDGSNDKTREILASYENKGNYKFIFGKRVGRAKALNLAIKAASNDIIAINDADDISFPNRTEFIKSRNESFYKYGIHGTDAIPTSKFPAPEEIDTLSVENDSGKHILYETYNLRSLYITNRFVHSSIFYQKDLWHELNGYNENLDICIDYDFIIRSTLIKPAIKYLYPTVLQYVNYDSYFRKIENDTYIEAMKNIRSNMNVDLITRGALKYYGFKRNIISRIWSLTPK